MLRIAKVVAEVPVDREFDYLVPPELAGRVCAGSKVRIPFGRTFTDGYVVGLAAASDRKDLKPIVSVLGDKPYVDEGLLKLAAWMAE